MCELRNMKKKKIRKKLELKRNEITLFIFAFTQTTS